MDFFARQDQARKQTRLLLVLFALTVAGVIGTVYGVLRLIETRGLPTSQGVAHFNTHPLFFAVLTLLLILGGSLVRTWDLRRGGVAIAEMLRARRVAPDARTPAERRLLNVIEEMALASGVAVPQAFVLDRESAINAFAAGWNTHDAVVAVSEGALHRLTRAELQGVVAHEFSHILNGDMRLNLRMLGLLEGLQMFSEMGEKLMSVRTDRGRDSGWLWLAGLAVFVVGYIGLLGARLIKAAVSRQREFLADASAVQFTRDRDGIGGALCKIGGLKLDAAGSKGLSGSEIRQPGAEAASHLFFAGIRPALLSGWFATHPSLEDRLERIYGHAGVRFRDAPILADDDEAAASLAGGAADAAVVAAPLAPIPWVSPLADPVAAASPPDPSAHTFTAPGTGAAMAAATAATLATAATAQPGAGPDWEGPEEAGGIPPALRHATRHIDDACALLFALLAAPGQEEAERTALGHAWVGLHPRALELRGDVARLAAGARLPLVDLAMPTLRSLSPGRRRELLEAIGRLTRADQRITLFEFVLETLLRQRLAPAHPRGTPVRPLDAAALREPLGIVLSLVALVAGAGRPEAVRVCHLAGAEALQAAGLATTPPAQLEAKQLDFTGVERALATLDMLAPLKKPLLARALNQAVRAGDPAQYTARETLQAICAALDMPYVDPDRPGVFKG